MLVDQLQEGIGADPARGDLRLHVADDEIRRANVVAHHCPEGVVALAALHHLEASELESLRVGIDRVDDAGASWGVGADVDVVSGAHAEADERLAEEHGTQNPTSGPWEAPP